MEMQEALRITADWYGRTWQSRMAAKRARWAPLQDELLARAGIRPGAKILDIGTGTGRTALGAATRTGAGGIAVGVDNARELLSAARVEAQSQDVDNAVFSVADMSSLPFGSEAFDTVLSSFAINAAHPVGSGLREASRVLKRGGSLAFSMFGKVREGADAAAAVEEVFLHHQPREPSPLLRRLPEAFAVAPFGFSCQGPLAEPADPFEVVDYVRTVGFDDVEANVTYARVVVADSAAAVDFLVGGRLDYAEMSGGEQAEARKRCASALESVRRDEGFVLMGQHVVYVTARKPVAGGR